MDAANRYLGVAFTKSWLLPLPCSTCCSLGGLGGLRGTFEPKFDEVSDLTETVALYDFGGGGLDGEAGGGEVGPGLAFGLAFVKDPKSLYTL